MLKVLTSDQFRDADAFTIAQEPIASIDLMERASRQCTDWICHHFNRTIPIYVIAGPGNNGGDGLAIARQLINRGRSVTIYRIASGNTTKDYDENLERLSSINTTIIAVETDDEIIIEKDCLVVDAIFGTGLTRPTEGLYAEIIKKINASGAEIISIDMPSGLATNENSKQREHPVILANHTLTFTAPKLSFLFPSNALYVGNFHILNIGIHPDSIEKSDTRDFFIEHKDMFELYKAPLKFAHKGTHGHLLILAGSEGMAGAAILAAQGALRAGAGLVTVAGPELNRQIVQSAIPEALYLSCGSKYIESLPDLKKYSSVLAGPGIGMQVETAAVIKNLIRFSSAPLILDADALNILSENKTWLAFLPKNTIVTPHRREFERLAAPVDNDETYHSTLREFSLKWNCITISKGAHTCTMFPEGNAFFNSSGNAGLAKGGSGDFLAGILSGLLARGYNAKEASLMGVYLHGLAADLALEDQSIESMRPGELQDYLGAAWKLILPFEESTQA